MSLENATRFVIRLTLTALLIVAALSGSARAETFTFTAIPDQDESRLMTRFGRVADYLADKLGLDVRYVPVKSYAAAVTAFRNDEVQLAWFGGLSGVQARQSVPGSTALAQGVEDKAFVSYFIAHTSTGLSEQDTLSPEVAGKTFTFGSKGSTSGRLMPEFYIRKAFNKAPDEVFSRVGFSGDHSRTIALVQSGAFQVGAVNYSVWESELAKGIVDTAKVRIVWRTPPYPDYQWSIRGDADARFGAGFTAKVRDALLNMKDPTLLKGFPRSGFIPATNADYQPIVDVGKSIGLLD